jgi:glutaredoxin-like protein
MSLLSSADQERLRTDFGGMTHPVRVLFFSRTIDCETCLQTREILDELPALSAMITIEEVNIVIDSARAAAYGIDHVPAVALVVAEDGGERDSRIRFVGMPAGYEFAALLRAVLLVGGGASHLSGESRDRLARVNRPLTVQVFSTPTCPHCPSAINLALEMAWANPNITAYAVEVTEFPDLARQFRVTGVPKTVVGGRTEILGALPEAAFVEQALAEFTAATAGDASTS